MKTIAVGRCPKWLKKKTKTRTTHSELQVLSAAKNKGTTTRAMLDPEAEEVDGQTDAEGLH
jgi:hypothetical protein